MPSEARAVAFGVVRRVFADGAYADRALPAEAGARACDAARPGAGHAPRLRHRAAQGHARPPDRAARRAAASHAWTRRCSRALRLGLYQLLYLDGAPDHAVVDDAVELAKRGARGGAGLVNAVLRRAAREGRDALLGALHDATPPARRSLHSMPLWIAEQWWDELGAETARALLARGQRARRARAARQHAGQRPRRRCRGPARADADPIPALPEALVARGAVRRPRLARCGARARDGRSRARRWLVARVLARTRRRARARPLRRAGRQGDAPGRADGRRRRGRRRRAHPGRARGAARHLRAAARTQRARRGRRRGGRPAPTGRSTACSSTRRAAASGRSRPAPTCAGG